MQHSSEKQDYNYSSENAYSSYQVAPPPYSGYPQQPIGGAGDAGTGNRYIVQAPLHQQKGIIFLPVQQRQFLNNRVITPITTSLRIFLLLSGFLSALWGIAAFSFQLAITVNSASTFYHGFWTGCPLIVGGILMMVIGFRPVFPLTQLIKTYYTILILSTLGFVLSIINYETSDQCTSSTRWNCDDSLIINLKIGLVIIFGFSIIHTLFNMIYIGKEHNQTISKSNSNVFNY